MAVTKGRLQVKREIVHGDRTLQTVTGQFDMQLIDDKQDLSTGKLKFSLAPSAVRTITLADFGITEGKYISIESDESITFQFNSALNTSYNITPPTDEPTGQVIDTNVKQNGFMDIKTSSVTSIIITNSSTTDSANVEIMATGQSS